MSEYIEREYVLKCMEDSYKNAGISAEAKAKMTRWLNKAPAADVRPVVRGRWELSDETPYIRKHYHPVACSNCHRAGMKGWNYCPNCGARMEES